jgi:predicted nucleic acid-binding protein
MQPPVVLLDACTLYPAALRDLLMRLALHRMIRARWTNAIHNEWIAAVLRDRPDLTRERLQRTRDLMNLHADDSLVTGYEKHIEAIELPDPNDRHVLAAAIEAEADILLTWNLRDFPLKALSPYGLVAEDPDTFFLRLLKNRWEEFLDVLQEARESLKHPPLSIEHYLEILSNQGLRGTCEVAKRRFSNL